MFSACHYPQNRNTPCVGGWSHSEAHRCRELRWIALHSCVQIEGCQQAPIELARALGRGVYGRISGALLALVACSFHPRRRIGTQRQAAETNVEPVSSTSQTQAALVRVTTYNVLHPGLCSERQFPHCKPEDLDKSVRWKRIEARLNEAIAHPEPSVMCFQELSEEWAASLHVLFEQHGWHFAYAVTPMMQWQPLAVALAWPTSSFTLEEMRIRRLGAEIRVPNQPRLSGLRRVFHTLTLGRLGGFPKEVDPWKLAASKQNRILMARLYDHRAGQSFIVATYHMPCLFGEAPYRQAKAIHSAILRRSVLRFAGGLNVVLAGDFNTTPHDSELLLLQKGSMSEEDIARPAPKHGLHLGKWLDSESSRGNSACCLRSAYADALGQEPPFTNYAWGEGQDQPFRQTIDYVLVSEGVHVEGVQAVPMVALGDPVFPSAAQPSDHVFLAADVWIGGAAGHRGKNK